MGEVNLEPRMLEMICRALDDHDKRCGRTPAAVRMHPKMLEHLDWDEVRGVPLEPDPQIEPAKLRIVCAGEADGIEDMIEEFREPLEPRWEPVVPVTVPWVGEDDGCDCGECY